MNAVSKGSRNTDRHRREPTISRHTPAALGVTHSTKNEVQPLTQARRQVPGC